MALDQAELTLDAPVTVALGAAGEFAMTTSFYMRFAGESWNGTTGIEYMDIDGIVSLTLSGAVSQTGGVTSIGNLVASEFPFMMPPAVAPAGTSVTLYLKYLFSANNRLTGQIAHVVAEDLNADGAVDGADLSQLLSVWG